MRPISRTVVLLFCLIGLVIGAFAENRPIRVDFSLEAQQAGQIELFPPGFSNRPMAAVTYVPAPADVDSGTFTMRISADPGEGILIRGAVIRPPSRARIRCSIRTSHAHADVTLAALPEDPAVPLLSIEADDPTSFVNQNGEISILFPSHSTAFRPAVQIVNQDSEIPLIADLHSFEIEFPEIEGLSHTAFSSTTILSVILNYLLWVFDFLCVLVLSFCVASLLPCPTRAHRTLLIALLFSSVIVLSGYLLSILRLLNSKSAWIILHLLLLTIGLSLWNRKQRPLHLPPAEGFPSFHSLPTWLRWIIGAFLLGFLFVLILNIFIPLYFIGYDGISYHLPRVYFYLQQGSMAPYPTRDIRQTDFPMVTELHFLWAVLFTKNIPLLFLFQWISLFLSGLAVYAACRAVTENRIACFATAFLWVSVPDILLHAAWIKNDTWTAAYAITALAFLLRTTDSFPAGILGCGMALGLAVGTKYSGLFPAAGIFIAGIMFLYLKKANRSDYLYYVIVTATLAVLLGGYSYIDIHFRGAGPSAKYPSSYTSFRPDYVPVNVLRLGGELTDSLVLPSAFSAHAGESAFPDLRKPLFRFLSRVPFCDVYGTAGFWAWEGNQRLYRLGASPIGFSLGTLVLMILGFGAAVRNLRNPGIVAILTAASIGLVLQAGILLWQPLTFLRFYLPVLVLFFPLSALAIERYFGRSSVLKWFVVMTSVIGSLSPILYYTNQLRLHYDPNLVTFYDRAILMFPRDKEIMESMRHYPKDMPVAIEGGIMAEQLLIGEHFERTVIPVEKIAGTQDIREIFEKYPAISMVIFSLEDISSLKGVAIQKIGDSYAAAIR